MSTVKHTVRLLLLALVLISTGACGPDSSSEPGTPASTATPEPSASVTPAPAAPTAEPTPTATPTLLVPELPTAETPPDPCSGASGQIEVGVLVGPADAVGLEPVAVGNVPYAVSTDEAPYLVQGAGPVSYADILVEQWGTYEVTMDLQVSVEGECMATTDGAQLRAVISVTGEQLVKVEAEGFQGEYPWAGSHSFDVVFPLEEGASVEGEGWTFVLHPDGL